MSSKSGYSGLVELKCPSFRTIFSVKKGLNKVRVKVGKKHLKETCNDSCNHKHYQLNLEGELYFVPYLELTNYSNILLSAEGVGTETSFWTDIKNWFQNNFQKILLGLAIALGIILGGILFITVILPQLLLCFSKCLKKIRRIKLFRRHNKHK